VSKDGLLLDTGWIAICDSDWYGFKWFWDASIEGLALLESTN
jgi:hypothetical protein